MTNIRYAPFWQCHWHYKAFSLSPSAASHLVYYQLCPPPKCYWLCMMLNGEPVLLSAWWWQLINCFLTNESYRYIIFPINERLRPTRAFEILNNERCIDNMTERRQRQIQVSLDIISHCIDGQINQESCVWNICL